MTSKRVRMVAVVVPEIPRGMHGCEQRLEQANEHAATTMNPPRRSQLGVPSKTACAAAFRKLTGKPERLAERQAGLTAAFLGLTILPTRAETSRPERKAVGGTGGSQRAAVDR